MRLRDHHKAETRALLLAAASDLFAEQGYEATTTRAVAARAGVATGTVFAHFPDKAALAGALLEERIAGALASSLQALPPGGLVAELVHVATALYAAYDARPELARALIPVALFSDATGPQLALLRAWHDARLARAVGAGELAPVDLELAFFHFFACYFGVLVGGLRGELSPKARGPLLAALLQRFYGGGS